MSGAIVQFRPTCGFSFEQLTVTTSVQVLTPTKYKPTVNPALTVGGASEALISVETASIRMTYDGTTPTATVGHLFTAGEKFRLIGQNQMSQFKCFRDTSASVDAVITITYERE